MRLTEIKITVPTFGEPIVNMSIVQDQPGETGTVTVSQAYFESLKNIATTIAQTVREVR